MSVFEQTSAPAAAPVFERILCATGGSDDDGEAVHQAAVLAGRGATVCLIAVTPEHPAGRPHPEPRQIDALVEADVLASRLGVRPEAHVVEASDEVTGMLARRAVHDLLVAPASDAAI